MAKKINLSDVKSQSKVKASSFKVAIVTASWNSEVTYAMRDAARKYLLENGISSRNIIETEVPGSFELPLGAQYMLEDDDIDGVICLGCIIQGETRHFDFIANAVAQGIMTVALEYNAPVSFGVLTTNNEEQAIARSGGSHGNKGIEAAAAVLSMLNLKGSTEA